MKNLSIILINLSILIILFSACEGKKLAAQYGSLPVDKEITATVGDTIIIDLIANASTGYKWEISYNSEEKTTLFIDKTHEADTSGRIGAAGKDFYKFLANKDGDSKVVFEYKKGDEVSKTMTYNIHCILKEEEK
jgi:predicted secreted protein